jgi:protein-L-isoaspartate(D-aspartate) O-methyltransferase
MFQPIVARAIVVMLAVIGATCGALSPGTFGTIDDDAARTQREEMVKTQLEARGIKDRSVLDAARKVPRDRFIPDAIRDRAHKDGPLPIGEGQTISQPYIVAWMTELIAPTKDKRVLEIGTGSGYQAAVLAECVAEVDTIEVVPTLGRRAERVLRELGYRNIRTRIGDGYHGWPERAPYDAIILTAAPPDDVPRPLLEQLKVGGRLVAPIGRYVQLLVRITRTETGYRREVLGPVLFVPMTGKAQHDRLTNSIGTRLVLIAAGEFLLGSPDGDGDDDEHPQHRVRITKPFYLGATEATRGQFRRFVDDTGYRTEAERDGKGGYGRNEATGTIQQNPKYTWRDPGFEQTDEHPVVNVSWNDAVAFCEWLSRKEGVTYRLPTEAEWEYACRAGTTTKYCSGDDPEGLAAVGNIADATFKAKYPNSTTIAARDGFLYTAPVGRSIPNAWGLFDMHGNVWEWCSDGYAADGYKRSPVDDPQGADGSPFRVIRGGSWNDEPRSARSGDRLRAAPVGRNALLGFRMARVQSVR